MAKTLDAGMWAFKVYQHCCMFAIFTIKFGKKTLRHKHKHLLLPQGP